MSIIKPYTFQGGTKARANEVNENFDRLYEQVNADITDIANMETEITNLGLDKANVAGNSLQRFAVADAVSQYDAVNKQTLNSYIVNTVDIITGLHIKKDGTNRIIVSSGSCYDSTKTKILKLQRNLGKTNSTQVSNATYYVYIIGSEDATLIDILISPDSVTPSLPEGYTLYRKIGYYNTGNNNDISNIYCFGLTTDAPAALATVTGSYHSGDSGYMSFSNGYKIQWGSIFLGGGNVNGNVYFLKPFSTSNYGVAMCWTAWQNAGDKGFSYSLGGRSTTSMNIRSQTERFNSQDKHIYWIASGF